MCILPEWTMSIGHARVHICGTYRVPTFIMPWLFSFTAEVEIQKFLGVCLEFSGVLRSSEHQRSKSRVCHIY